MKRKISYVPMIVVFVLLAANMAYITYMSTTGSSSGSSVVEDMKHKDGTNDLAPSIESKEEADLYDHKDAYSGDNGEFQSNWNEPEKTDTDDDKGIAPQVPCEESDDGDADDADDDANNDTSVEFEYSSPRPEPNALENETIKEDTEPEENLSYPGDDGSDTGTEEEEEQMEAEGNGTINNANAEKIDYPFDYPERWGCTSHDTELSRLKVELAIDNSYAVTDIQFGLSNPGQNITQKSFVVTIPEGAMLSNLTMELNGAIYYSKIFSKTDEVSEMTGPDIMAVFIQWLDDDSLQMNVRVPPNSVMGINLRYEKFLARYLGEFQYTVPLHGINSNEEIKELITILDIYHQSGLSDLGVSGPIYHSNLTVTEAQAAGMRTSRARWSLDDLNIGYTVGEPALQGDVTVHENGDEGHFLLRFSPSATALEEAPVPKQIIFVIDRSGSMSGNKIAQVRNAFAYIVDDLPGDDMFNILTFSSSVSQYSSGMMAASETNKASAVNFINGMSASGGTNFNQAALDAMGLLEGVGSNYIPIVVLLTDGQPTSGETTLARIRDNIMSANTMHASVFCLGFGGDVDFDFLRAISMENFGQGIKISEYGDATSQITDFYKTISTPLLQQLTFSFSDEVGDVSRTSADYLFAGTDIVITGRFVEADSIDIIIDARSRNGQRRFTDTIYLSGDNRNPFVARLWAYQQIENILEQMEVFGERQDLRERVIELSCQYNFLTKYTCFLVEVDDENVWNPENDGGDEYEPDPEPEEEPEEDDDTNSSNRSRSWNPLDEQEEMEGPDSDGNDAGYEAGDEKKALAVRKSD